MIASAARRAEMMPTVPANTPPQADGLEVDDAPMSGGRAPAQHREQEELARHRRAKLMQASQPVSKHSRRTANQRRQRTAEPHPLAALHAVNYISTSLEDGLTPADVLMLSAALARTPLGPRGRYSQGTIDHLTKVIILMRGRQATRAGRIEGLAVDAPVSSNTLAALAFAGEQQAEGAEDIPSIDVSTMMTHANIMLLRMLINPKSLHKRKLLVFDTKFQQLDEDYPGTNSWSLAFDSITVANGVTVQRGLRNIIAMKLDPPRWPQSAIYGYTIQNATGDVFQPIARYTVGIEELLSQACIGTDGWRFHFMMQILYTNFVGDIFDPHPADIPWSEMSTEDFNNGYFRFEHPITTLNTVTLRFAQPFLPFDIAPNRVGGYVVQNSNPLVIDLIRPLDIIWMSGQDYTIVGFTTGDPTADAALIAEVADYDGPAVLTTTTTLEFPIDVSSMTPRAEAIRVSVLAPAAVRAVYPITFVYFDAGD